MGSFGSDEGQFIFPYGLAIDINGNVYATDTENYRIQKFDSNGQFIALWGKRGSNGRFWFPYGLTVSPEGSLYVADTSNSQIQRFASNGTLISRFGTFGVGDGEFKYPYAVAIGSDGSVYVADTGSYRIQKFDNNNNFITKWGNWGSGDGQFSNPQGIAISPDGFIYVTDYTSSRVQKFDSNGNYITKWGSVGSGNGQFANPHGIAIGPDGFIFIADTSNHRIQKFDGNGNFITKWGSRGSGDGQFNYPHGVAVGNDGYVYVADTENYRIQMFDSNGTFIAKWGSFGKIGDGQFYLPNAITVSHDGYVYVADTYSSRIQRMAPTGGSAETLFETTLHINQPDNASQDYITNIGALNTAGKFFLQAELKNSLGQTVSKAEYPFYLVEGNTVLLFNTDKKYYKAGETVTISGEAKNLSSVNLSGLNLQLLINSQSIYTATFDLPANGSYPFTVTTVSGTDRTYTLTGKVTQSSSTLVEVSDQYEVVSPNVTATVSSPEVIDNEPFNINVELKNEGISEAVVSLESSIDSQTQTVTIPAGETRLIQYSQQITNDTTYTFTFTGYLDQTITKTVSYVLGASIAINPLTAYPEGRVSIPVTITNIGQLDENLTLTYSLQPSSLVQQKTYFIAKNGSLTDILYFVLTEGSYELSASSQQPAASTQTNFSVRKENKVEMSISSGAQTNELIPVTVNLSNIGYNEVSGSIQLSAISSQGISVWKEEQSVSQLLPQNSQLSTFNINSSALEPKAYTLKAEFLNNSGQQLGVLSLPFTVYGPIFQITQLPPSQTFTVGEEATFTFKVKDTGNKEGAFDFHFKAYDLIDSTKQEWLMANEEKTVTFSFTLPVDLEEKDYYADYELKGQGSSIKGQVLYHLEGISLSVDSSLDKQYYSEGETAHLTIVVSQESGVGSLNLFARVNYNGYENQQPFTLNGTGTLEFDVPLTEITGEKLFYGVYHESGRSIHLNSLYIYKVGDSLTITTDKQVYNPGETVSITVHNESGTTSSTLTLSALNYSETFVFTGVALKSFTLPDMTTSGTYHISYEILL